MFFTFLCAFLLETNETFSLIKKYKKFKWGQKLLVKFNLQINFCRSSATSDRLIFVLVVWFFSVATIIEEYEENLEQARNEAKSIKSNQSTPSKKNDLSGILSRPTAATNEVDFSFGGPVADEGGMKIGYKKEGILIFIPDN